MDEKEIVETEELEEEVVEDSEVEDEEKEAEVSYGRKLVSRDTFTFSIRDICEMAIFCAIAVVLDRFVRIGINDDGGSINIAMLPLFIIALRQGWFKGFIAGAIIFGLATCMLDGWGFVWYPTDYFVGFGSVGILGLLKPVITDKDYNVTWHSYAFSSVGILAACIVRYIACTFSGIVIGGYPFVVSLAKNAAYVFPSFIAVLTLFLGLLINILKAFRAHNTKSL